MRLEKRSAAAARVRVLIADGHLLLPEAVRALLSPDPDIEVVGVTYDAGRVLALVDELEPHLLLLDSDLPGMDRLPFLDRLGELHPNLAAVLLTQRHDSALESAALEHGARGVIVKGSDPAALAPALRGALPEPTRRTPREPALVRELAVARRGVRPHIRLALEAVAARVDEARAQLERAVFGNDYDWL